MFGLRTPELLLILVIVLLVFGAGKLPDVAGSLGKSIREFRKHSQADEAAGPRRAEEAKAQEPKSQASK